MPQLSIIQKAVLGRAPGLGIPSGGRVLDAPCGAAALTIQLSQAGFEAWGADLDAEARDILKEHFVEADLAGKLPWPGATFNAVFSIEGIEHLDNRFQFLRECCWILKPGGVLVITTPNICSLRSRVRYFFSGFYHKDPRPLNESLRHPLHHIALAGFPDLRYALHTTGFRITQTAATHVKPVSYFYGLLAAPIWLYTRLAFRKEKDAAQKARNAEIRRTLMSPALLFGENLIIVARKPL